MTPIPSERIDRRIYMLRGHRIMLSTDLGGLYEVEAGALVRAVKRNIKRFPPDFAFQLSDQEFENLKSQIGMGQDFLWKHTGYSIRILDRILRIIRAARSVSVAAGRSAR